VTGRFLPAPPILGAGEACEEGVTFGKLRRSWRKRTFAFRL